MNGDKSDRDWDKVARTVTPLRKKSSRAQNSSIGPNVKIKSAPMMRVPVKEPFRIGVYGPVAINRDKKIRRGHVSIEAKLDLHNMTQKEAFVALRQSVIRASSGHISTLLVITGKGKRLEGVLRTRFQDWVNHPDIRPFIASMAPAHMRHGGLGAWYIFIKNKP